MIANAKARRLIYESQVNYTSRNQYELASYLDRLSVNIYHMLLFQKAGKRLDLLSKTTILEFSKCQFMSKSQFYRHFV